MKAINHTEGRPFQEGKRILATKILGKEQKDILQRNGYALTEYNAITISMLKVPLPSGFDHFIFSSKNGVNAFLKLMENGEYNTRRQHLKCYCVGHKTAALLKKNGLEVKVAKPGSVELAQYIISGYARESFLYPCGNMRREELPGMLEKHNVKLEEVVVYKTDLNAVQVEATFDKVLFFSPSGVESFFKTNTLQGAEAWCIGPTTAEAVTKYTDRFKVAPNPDTDTLITTMLNETNSAGSKAK